MKEYIDDKPIEFLDPEEENLIFHYERGSFRKREDSTTRDLATGKVKTSPGLFRVLVSTKSNRFVFFTMLIFVAVTFLLGIFRRSESDYINGIKCSASAFSFNGKIYATVELEKSVKKTDELPIQLELFFECINEEETVADKYSESVLFIPKDKQFVRTIFTDYDIKSVKVLLKSEGKEITLNTKIKQS